MKLTISGVDYDYGRAMHQSKLTHLRDLKIASGVTPRRLVGMLDRMGSAADIDELNDVLEDEGTMAELMGLIFLCRRTTDPKVSYADATDVAWGDFQFTPEPGDIAEQPDPPMASGDQSQPAAGTPNVQGRKSTKPSKRTSKTSNTRSTSTSSR